MRNQRSIIFIDGGGRARKKETGKERVKYLFHIKELDKQSDEHQENVSGEVFIERGKKVEKIGCSMRTQYLQSMVN